MAGGKKNRKWNRNKKWCEEYRQREQREKNKRIRIKRYFTQSLRHIEKRLKKIHSSHKDRDRLKASQHKLTRLIEEMLHE